MLTSELCYQQPVYVPKFLDTFTCSSNSRLTSCGRASNSAGRQGPKQFSCKFSCAKNRQPITTQLLGYIRQISGRVGGLRGRVLSVGYWASIQAAAHPRRGLQGSLASFIALRQQGEMQLAPRLDISQTCGRKNKSGEFCGVVANLNAAINVLRWNEKN